ncbi:hypothetical protein JL721_5351 [Aureococcus anophagefferens]|nr:hypothetical protein JL721_5351 [Aureococcus anophagefferens]
MPTGGFLGDTRLERGSVVSEAAPAADLAVCHPDAIAFVKMHNAAIVAGVAFHPHPGPRRRPAAAATFDDTAP